MSSKHAVRRCIHHTPYMIVPAWVPPTHSHPHTLTYRPIRSSNAASAAWCFLGLLTPPRKTHLPPCMHAPSCTQDPPAGHACRPARKKICRSCRRIHLRIPLHRIWDSQPAWMCHVRPKCREAVAAHIPKVSDPQESPLQSFTQTSLQSVMSWWQCSVQHRASESNQER